jgi:hypothetical protein
VAEYDQLPYVSLKDVLPPLLSRGVEECFHIFHRRRIKAKVSTKVAISARVGYAVDLQRDFRTFEFEQSLQKIRQTLVWIKNIPETFTSAIYCSFHCFGKFHHNHPHRILSSSLTFSLSLSLSLSL